jgi:prepilin-type N-terminal cleavage/methylation domain-containing protein
MKLSNLKKSSMKGFTLIELLVVISIIATLGALSYGPYLRHLETADVNKTVVVCKALTGSIELFESEYDSLPYSGASYPAADTTYITNVASGKDFLDVLMGANNAAALAINDKGKEYFTADQSKGTKDGLVYAAGNLVSLLDTWGNPYKIRLDYDGDGIINSTAITSPAASGTAYKTDLHVSSAIVATPGKDTIYNDIKDAKSW